MPSAGHLQITISHGSYATMLAAASRKCCRPRLLTITIICLSHTTIDRHSVHSSNEMPLTSHLRIRNNVGRNFKEVLTHHRPRLRAQLQQRAVDQPSTNCDWSWLLRNNVGRISKDISSAMAPTNYYRPHIQYHQLLLSAHLQRRTISQLPISTTNNVRDYMAGHGIHGTSMVNKITINHRQSGFNNQPPMMQIRII